MKQRQMTLHPNAAPTRTERRRELGDPVANPSELVVAGVRIRVEDGASELEGIAVLAMKSRRA